MTRKTPRGADPRLRSLLEAWAARILALDPSGLQRWLLVDATAQRVHLVRGRRAGPSWPVSTAAAGLNCREGSLGTPTGLHRIHRKIGQGLPPGAVFSSREFTGRIWAPPADGAPGPGRADPDADADADLILTRILTLDGQQEGVNHGPGVDSLGRYIYLHGTNHEDAVGSPASHGCVRMTNRDVIQVFDLVAEGDFVVIV